MDMTEARWAHIFSALAEGVIVLDASGRIEMCNGSAERILGLTAGQMTGVTSMDPRWRAIHEDGSPFPGETHPAMVTLRTGQALTGVIMGVHKPDGTLTWISINSHPILRDGKPQAVVTIFADVTEQKVAKHSLRAEEERWKTVVEGARDGIWDWDGVTNTAFYSRRWKEIIGFEEGEIGNTPSEWEDRIHPEDKPSTLAARNDHLNGKTPFYEAEYRLKCKDGTWKWLFARGAVVSRGADGKPLRFVGAQTDITERKRAEGALRERNRYIETVLEKAPIGFAVHTIDDGVGRFVSARYEEIYGVPRGAIDSHYTFFDKVWPYHPDLREQIRGRVVADMQSGDASRMHWENIPVPTATGETRYITAMNIPLLDQNLMVSTVWDVTEHVRAEEALGEAHRRLAATVAAIPDLMFETDVKGRIYTYHAPAGESLAQPESFLGKTVADVLPPAAASVILEALAQAADKGWHRGARYALDMASGRHWFELSIATKPGGSAQDERFVALARDITERKRAEEALRKSEALYRLLAVNVSDVIWIMDLEVFRFRYVSPSIERMLGYTAEEIMERDPMQVVTADSASFMGRVVPQRINDYKTGLRQVYTDEIEQPCRNGSTVWVETTSHYVMNEHSGHLEAYGVSRDISERKRAQEKLRLSQQQLRESTERFLAVAKCAPDTIFSMDLSGRFTYVSPNIVRSHGYTAEEALKLNRRDTATPRQVVAGDLLINEELQRAALPTYDRNHMMTFESEQLRKDGTTFWAEVNASLIWSDEGRPVGITGVARDITERKRAEAEREKLWAQLSQAQKMESIGRLAGGVAHDFGNILSTMMLQIGVAIAGPDMDPLIKRTLEELQTQAEGAANLIQQLLQFSRRSVMIRKSLDLNNVVANLIKMLGRLIGENISLRFEPHQGVAAVNADVGMMEQVIMNLAVNARDAMPRGGRLTIRIESVDVGEKHAKARPEVPPAKFICLSVSDTGCGIDEDTLKHIFEPFFTTKEPGKGTGLGLSTVHGIVGQHQGWAEAESELGRGSTFRVFLPAAERPAPDTEQSETRAAVWGNETILLVEDAAKLREMIAESLRLLGYQVIEAGNGQEAMQKWQEHQERIDMLLSDIVLPGHLTGLELAEKFRESKPGLKIILSSSYSAEMVDDGRLSAGNMAYLRKPYRIEVLSKAIRDCFEQG